MPDVNEVPEAPRYEKPAVKKIGNMSANTKQKTPID
jgi:hypothetical protein